jgi:glucosamine-6-phosphate deaminase
MLVVVKKNHEEVSREGVRVVAGLLREKPSCTLGLATGSTPLLLYRELIRMYEEEGLDLSKVTTFNLDEYIGLPPSHPQSYHYFMYEHLFRHVNIPERFIHIPSGMVDVNDIQRIHRFCEWYEKRIVECGGIDLQLLGVGANGHIGFNEPGSSLGSRTRIKTLSQKTREDNSRFFDDDMEKVPRYAITMGIGTILDSRMLLLLASGENKAEAIRDTVEGAVTAQVPASIVQMHRRAVLIVDEEAGSLLSGKYDQFLTELQ